MAAVIGLIAGFAGGLLSKVMRKASAPDGERKAIRTTNLALVDDQGRERGSFTVTPNGSSVAEMMARSSKARVTLSIAADGQIALTSFDERGAQVTQWP